MIPEDSFEYLKVERLYTKRKNPIAEIIKNITGVIIAP
jgi:hypothetical protein